MTKNNDVADQAAQREDLDGERVRRCKAVPMRGEERLPGGLRAALRCGLDAVVLEDSLDRIAGDVVTETLEPTADARVAPGRVLRRHADHQRGEIRLGARATTVSCLRAVVFLGYQRPIPAQDGVRCDDTRDSRQSAPAKKFAFHGQAAALVVGEVEPSRSVRGAEGSVLLEQVVNNGLLLPVDPAREEENNERERRRQRVHGASVPERLVQCKARQIRRYQGGAELPDRKPPAIAANAPIVEQSGLAGFFAHDGITFALGSQSA
jgi:hypothetical protein